MSDRPPPAAGDYTPRAIAIGAALAAVIGVGVPYGSLVVQGTDLALTANTPAAFVLLFAWILLAQTGLGALSRRARLGRGELIVVFAMLLVAAAVPTRGLTGMLFATITGPLYYATPENNWRETILPLIPEWAFPHDPEGVRQFYEGVPAGGSPAWQMWVEPLCWWLLLIGAFYLASTCLVVILRKEWVEHERLAYPLAQVPLALLPAAGERQLLPPLLRRTLFWLGLLVSFGVHSVTALNKFSPVFPALTLATGVTLVQDRVHLGFRLSFLILGFAYFIHANAMLGLWVFYLLKVAQVAVLEAVGATMHERLAPFSGWGGISGILGHQTTGAMLVFVGVFLWSARGHLAQVGRRALGLSGGADDAGEVLSYRQAVLGLLAGLAVMAVWLSRAGLPAWAALVFLLGAFATFLALTRMLVETGLPTVTPRLIPCDLLVSGVGVSALGAKGVMALATTFVWAGDLLVFLMAPVAHGLRLSGETVGRRSRLLWAMGLALGISLSLSMATFLWLAYAHGAINLYPQYFASFPRYPFEYAADLIGAFEGPNWAGWGLTLLGAGLMGALTFAHRHLPWWPLHPVGFVVATDWVMNNTWFSIFLAWLVKSCVLKYGGPGLYRRTVPLFVGLILGQFAAAGFWLVVDGLLGRQGTYVPVY